jgi:chromosome segregation ATPase
MTDDVARAPTLDDVRQRFLDAETSLSGIGATLERLSGAAAGIGQARQSIDQAGASLGQLATRLSETAAELGANAVALREGVDAIRLGDPAEVRRQLNELDAGFGAFQGLVVERLTAIESRQSALEATIVEVRRRLHELDTGFGAFQASVVERLTAIESRQSSLEATIVSDGATTRSAEARTRLEMRVGLLIVAAVGLIAVILPLVRP